MFERLDQHIAPAQVEYFGPKAIVSPAGAHQETRRERKLLSAIQEIPPGSVRLVALADDNRHWPPAQKCQRLPAACASVQLPVGMGKNLTQGSLVLGGEADQQNRSRLVGHRNKAARATVAVFFFLKRVCITRFSGHRGVTTTNRWSPCRFTRRSRASWPASRAMRRASLALATLR